MNKKRNTKKNKIIINKQNIAYVDINQLKKIYLTNTFQIACEWENDKEIYQGEIQKIYLDNNNKAFAYDIYTLINKTKKQQIKN